MAAASLDTRPRGAPARAALAPGSRGLRAVWWLVFLLSLLPLGRLITLGLGDGLGANPVEFVTRSTGTWTLVFLCVTLSITPLRWLTGQTWLIRLRRLLGLYAFFYGMLHFTTWVWFDQWFDVLAMLRDIAKRPFITVGFLAWLAMVPLALTSNGWAMRRLGRRWQALHRLVYAIAALGVLHYWWHKAGKNDLAEPAVYAVVVGVLLAARAVHWLRRRRARPSSAAR